MSTRVMITGLGAVSGFGLTTEAFWQGISQGQCAIKPLDPLEGIKMTLGARLPDYDEKQFFSKDDL
ncbi:MAG: beta-ketoacyl synthase N-terminal-like domain-containing protein, partial [Gammaproteobacteria bacterium]